MNNFKQKSYIAFSFVLYCIVLYPLSTLIFYVDGLGTLLTVPLGTVMISILLLKLLKVGERNPHSPMTLLIHNVAVFTRRFLIGAGIALLALVFFKSLLILPILVPLSLFIYFLWFVGSIIVLLHTAHTKKIYALPKDFPPLTPQLEGVFYPYVLIFVIIEIIFLFSLFFSRPYARQTVTRYYQFYVKEDIPLTERYASNSISCDSYKKNTNNYASCKIEQYSSEGIFKSESMDCSDMYVYDDDCLHLQTIQSAIAKQDSSLCNSLQSTNQFPLCIGQFPQSPIWQSGCETIMNKALNKSGNFAFQLIDGRCLTQANANLTVSRSKLGGSSGSVIRGEYDIPYKKRYVELNRTTSIHFPQSPVWFTNEGMVDQKTVNYLKSIHADPNNTDDFGRTTLILFMNHLSYLVSSAINRLPVQQQSIVVEKELEPLKILIQFGVDPSKKDLIGKNAFDHAQEISNDVLRAKAIEIMGR